MKLNLWDTGSGFTNDGSHLFNRGLNINYTSGNGENLHYSTVEGKGYGFGKGYGNISGNYSSLDFDYPFELIQFWE